MASLLTKLFNYAASTPINTVTPVDDDQNQLVGANGVFVGGSTDKKLFTKSSDAVDPPYDMDQLGAGPLARWKQNGILKASILNSGQFKSEVATGTPPLDVASTTEVPNLNAGRVGGILPANIAKLDTHKTAFSTGWLYANIPGAVESVETVQRFIVPAGTEIQIIDITAVWADGADSAASNIFTIKRRNSTGTLQTDVGTIDINTPAQNALHVVTLGSPLTLTAGDQLYTLLTTRNTGSEKLVNISIRGKQKVTT